ncbi:cyclic nucleotide-binding domain-containing protein [candidate division KSB1 bacterium]|nr:cyclic nucleotide-binding domain-containing protein [candidate division KSB1 bacterium]
MSAFWSKIFSHEKKGEDNSHLDDVLKEMPIFEKLTRRELHAIIRILHKREFKTDEVIFRENEPGMGMYIIEQGKVAIVSESAKMQLTELSAGAFFGEIALLDAAPRSASAIAKSDCKLFGFFQPDLFGLIERNPQLGVKVVLGISRLVCERLRQTNKRAFAFNEALQQMKHPPQ